MLCSNGSLHEQASKIETPWIHGRTRAQDQVHYDTEQHNDNNEVTEVHNGLAIDIARKLTSPQLGRTFFYLSVPFCVSLVIAGLVGFLSSSCSYRASFPLYTFVFFKRPSLVVFPLARSRKRF